MCQIMRGGITKPLTPLDFAKHSIIFSSYQNISWIDIKTESVQSKKEHLQYNKYKKYAELLEGWDKKSRKKAYNSTRQ